MIVTEFNEDNDNRRSSKDAESSSDQNTTADTNESGSHSVSCSTISGNPNGNIQWSERSESVEDDINNAINRYGCLSIGNGTTSPGTPNGISQEERLPILDKTTSIVSNGDIVVYITYGIYYSYVY